MRPASETCLSYERGVEQGTEPLLFAATSPDAEQGAYYGPGGAFGLVGPTRKAKLPRSARRVGVAEKLWAEAERLTATSLPNLA